ncbi:MAG TPA: nucleotidyltransferase domain-containing protein [Pirellulales bacterium]|jgi:predicted nucleotidyltransferase|nr:nucleotidyltransferase domain-containing protein [Pirellulales bacterium]
MRKKAPSESLLFPHVRQRVLATFLLHSKTDWYLSELVRQLKSAPAHLHRELGLLVEAGVLRRRVEGRQVYYSPDRRCPYLPELAALVRKTLGIPVTLSKALEPLGTKIECAFIYGSMAKGREQSGSDIDLMVVGSATISDLLPALAKAEKQSGRPVNPTVYSKKELAEKNRQGNHFVRAVLADPAKTFLIGTRDDFEKAANGRAVKASQDKPGRARRTSRRHPD